jgi:hypothetical protein
MQSCSHPGSAIVKTQDMGSHLASVSLSFLLLATVTALIGGQGMMRNPLTIPGAWPRLIQWQ